MKTSIKYLLMGASLLVTLPQLTACSDDDAVDPYDLNYVYIYSPNQADNNLEYKANGTFITTIEEQCVVNPVRCTKPAPSDLTVELSIDGSLVDSYNQAHGTSYTLLKGAKLENSTLTIKKGEYASEQSLRVVYTDMSEFQNGTENYILPIAISKLTGSGALVSETTGRLYLTFTSKYKANRVMFTRSLYTEQFTFKSSGFTNPVEQITLMQPVLSEWNADADIRISLSIDYDKIELYNSLNSTNYLPMPVDVTLSTDAITIPKGSNMASDELALIFADAMAGMPLEEARYMIPIVMKAVEGEGAEMDEDAKVYYVAINCVLQPFAIESGSTAGTRLTYDGSWTMTVNGQDNSWGYPWTDLLSGNAVDYWSTGEEMIIDFGSEQNLWFIQIGTSYGSNYSYKKMKVETSTDGSLYEGDEVTVTPGKTINIKITEPRPIRYLRLTPTNNQSDGYPTSLKLYVSR